MKVFRTYPATHEEQLGVHQPPARALPQIGIHHEFDILVSLVLLGCVSHAACMLRQVMAMIDARDIGEKYNAA